MLPMPHFAAASPAGKEICFQLTMNFYDSHKILFERPELDNLNQQYTVVDMHFHSRYSDGKSSVKAIAQRAHQLGIGIAVTDHNEIKGALEIDGFKEVFSIPGIEITSREGTHLLVYFYDIDSLRHFYIHHVKPHLGPEIMSSTALPMEALIDRARAYETVIIFPHPYSATFTGICNPYFSQQRRARLFAMADGIEVINAENLNKWNLRSSLLGFNLGKAITGGSDGHRLLQMGKAVCCASCKPDRRAFLEAVKTKQTRVIGKEIDIIHKVTSNSVKLRSNIKNYPHQVGKNLRYSCTVLHSKSKALKDNIKRSLHDRFSHRHQKYGAL
jgi:predicted metal-dependent phosphoesterase TrpH